MVSALHGQVERHVGSGTSGFAYPPRGKSMVSAQHGRVGRCFCARVVPWRPPRTSSSSRPARQLQRPREHVRSGTPRFAYPPADRAWCRLNMVRSKGTCEVGHLASPTPPRTEHGVGSTWSGRRVLLRPPCAVAPALYLTLSQAAPTAQEARAKWNNPFRLVRALPTRYCKKFKQRKVVIVKLDTFTE